MSATTRRERLEKLVREVNPTADLAPEAVALLDQLASTFLDNALQVGEENANERQRGEEIRICDLRGYVQDQLGLEVAGFALEDLLDEAACGSRAVIAALRKKESSKKH